MLLTRPADAGAATAARLRAAGHDVLSSPLLEPVPCAWMAPEDRFDALLLTSAQAARLAGEGLARFAHLPAYAVGASTAAAARDMGLADVRAPTEAGVATLYDAILANGHRRILHLAGRDLKAVDAPAGLTVERRIVYEARLASDLSDEARAALQAGRIDWALLFSARTATHFAALCDAAAIARDRLSIAAISASAATAAGTGWADVRIAEKPDEAGVLAAAGLLCDKQ